MAFTLATYNVQDLLDPDPTPESGSDAERAFHEKIRSVGQALGRMDADIVCLQEVGSAQLLSHALEHLPRGIDPYPTRVVGEVRDRRGLRLAILSRFPLRQDPITHGHGSHRGPFGLPVLDPQATPRKDFTFRRGLLEARLQVPEVGDVTVFSAHLKSNFPVTFSPPPDQHALSEGLVRSAMTRFAEALRIRKLVDDRLKQEPDHPLVVAGDFNEGEDSLLVRLVRGDRPDEVSRGLEGGALYPVSDLVDPARRWTNQFRGRGELLDHMLVSRSLHARHRATWILNDNMVPAECLGDRAGNPPDSDHAPVIAEFR